MAGVAPCARPSAASARSRRAPVAAAAPAAEKREWVVEGHRHCHPAACGRHLTALRPAAAAWTRACATAARRAAAQPAPHAAGAGTVRQTLTPGHAPITTRPPTVEQLTVAPVKVMSGTVKLPGSKSLSNRILLLAALASGTTLVRNLLVRRADPWQ